jgi:hypothetical protein
MKRYLPAIFYLFLFTLFLFLCSCSESSEDSSPLFKSVPIEKSNILFENNLNSDSDLNVYKYRNFYNGGGVAVGDVNQDSLPDVYLTANRGGNKLYINKGDFVFEDVTDQAGVSGSKPWTTGASFVDINDDGLLDIYVTNAGEFKTDQRRNELFINNGNGTFTESAASYGLDHPGYSIHASFFDYDLDGDLDMYLLNNSDASIVDFDLNLNHRENRDELGGDKLFRNDGGSFTDVTQDAGIYSPEIGFGLSASISDLNRDGYPDIYVANDFFEYDYLYINNGDGTFEEVLKTQINSISAASMGTDIADLTNNGWPDIYVTDMLPTSDQRTKMITTYENWELFSEKQSQGYHYQLTRNTLQLNNGNGTYSEVGRLADVQASDWSWATLIADFDLNGHNDILVTNGLIQDITNLDYIEDINRPDMIRSIISDDNVDYDQLVEMIPSNPVPNVLFANYGNLDFKNKAEEWGIGVPGYSSGAAWADFDNDGDLDLIINDVNGPSKLYQNQATQQSENNWLKVTFEGESPNRYAIGATVEVWADSSYWYREHFLQRGYQSSVEPGIFLGLADHQRIDSLKVRWPDRRISFHTDLSSSQTILVRQSESSESDLSTFKEPAFIAGDIDSNHSIEDPFVTEITEQVGLDWSHVENHYVDFNREPLLLHMRSTEGPALCSGDVNNDGFEDFYIGGARDQTGALILQTQNGGFKISKQPVFSGDALSEDTDCVFLDSDGDGDQDLFVTSGGNSFSTGASALFDRLYLNNGDGTFEKYNSLLPTGGFSSNSTVSAADFNGDGFTDLFVGERLKPFSFGMPVRGFVLINDGNGNFSDESTTWKSDFEELGMITDSAILDWDGDGLQDLVVVGEWMPIRLFRNTGSSFEEITEDVGLSDTRGLWNTIHVTDINQDGRVDLVGGNLGLNTHFETSQEAPLKMWINDFENDGVPEQILTRSIDGKEKPFVLKHDLLNQIPSLRSKYPEYSDYADQSIQDIFTTETLERSRILQTDILESIVIINSENGLEIKKLPLRSQYSPIYGFWSGKLTHENSFNLITVGNLYEVKPMAGQYDASYGTVLTSDLKSIPESVSGLSIKGSGRKAISVENSSGETILIIARNNASPLFFRVN